MMSPAQMLAKVTELGRDNGAVHDDEAGGWFSWEIVGDMLIVTFEDQDGETDHRWMLRPVD